VTPLAFFDVFMHSHDGIAGPTVLELLRFPVDYLGIFPLVLRMTDSTALFVKTMQPSLRIYPFSDVRVTEQTLSVGNPLARFMATSALTQAGEIPMGRAEIPRGD